MNITNNVADLMVSRIKELPPSDTGDPEDWRRASAAVSMLATLEMIVTDQGTDTFDHLRPAIEAGLVVPDRDVSRKQDPTGGPANRRRLRFLHDRVQQAAYAMLTEQRKREVHLQIGLQLESSLSDTAKAERLFEIVDHLNIGGDLVLDEAKRKELAALNLDAARRAVSATAYSAACDYAVAGLNYVSGDSWQTEYELTRDLHRVQVDAEYLRGDFEASQRLISSMLPRLRTPTEQAEVQSALVIQQTLSGDYRQAIATCCEALDRLGMTMPTENLELALREELDRYPGALRGRELQLLLESPEVTSHDVPVALAAVSQSFAALLHR